MTYKRFGKELIENIEVKHYTKEENIYFPINKDMNYKLYIYIGKLEFKEITYYFQDKVFIYIDINKKYQIREKTPTGLLKNLYKDGILLNKTITSNWKSIFIKYDEEEKWIAGDDLRTKYFEINNNIKTCSKNIVKNRYIKT